MSKLTTDNWTPRDTAICERAEANGYAFNLVTGKPMMLNELIQIRNEYQKVKNIVSIEEFKKGKWMAKPYADFVF